MPRPRRRIPRALYWLARHTGFYRYSAYRNALILRFVGDRHGPVLVRRGDDRPARVTAPTAPVVPAPRAARETPPARPRRNRVGVTLDLACLPLPHMPNGRPIWQLTGVESHTTFSWANLVAPKAGRPSVSQIDAFVARIGAAMAERGEQLTAVTIQVGSALPSAALRSLQSAGIDVRRRETLPPERSAVALHSLFLRRHWQARSEEPSDWDLMTLERELQGWVRDRNLEALVVH